VSGINHFPWRATVAFGFNIEGGRFQRPPNTARRFLGGIQATSATMRIPLLRGRDSRDAMTRLLPVCSRQRGPGTTLVARRERHRETHSPQTRRARGAP